MTQSRLNELKARRLGITGSYEAVAFLRADSPICRAEGFDAHSRVQLSSRTASVTASLRQVSEDWLGLNEVGLNEAAWQNLALNDQETLSVQHAPIVTSFRAVRRRIFGTSYSEHDLNEIVGDITAGRFSDLQLTAFVTDAAAQPLSAEETIKFTRAMIETGTRLHWPDKAIYDKHCVGGLPGNRTTPLVVSIVAEHGLKIPKTSSRAVTSPAGTADTMETITRVDLSVHEVRSVVETHNGCFVWGSALDFSPVDEAVIRVERALDFDAPASMVSSVLSKKVGAGATHVLIDIPVGPTAKIRNTSDAERLSDLFNQVAEAVGLTLKIEITDGRQPIGFGIGPALEARDILAVLKGETDAPAALAEKACALAGALLELSGKAVAGEGAQAARETLRSGAAFARFRAICEAQGAFRVPPQADHTHVIKAARDGVVSQIDNRRLSTAAKLTGAPEDAAAGLDLHVRLGDRVKRGDALYTLHAVSIGELAYVLDYVSDTPDIIHIGQ